VDADAEQIKGTESSADGPALTAGKVYADTIAPGEQLYYKVTLDKTSNAYVSALAAPKPDGKVGYNDGISVKLLAADNTECGGSDATFGVDGRTRPIVNWAWRQIGPDQACQAEGVHNVLVQRTSAPTSDPSDWKLELRFKEEPGLKKAGSSAAPEPESLPSQPPTAPSGTAKKIEGGRGVADAAGMSTGAWRDKLRPGETHFYRVPVDFGQQLFTDVEFGTAKVTDAAGWHGDGVAVDIYNPGLGYVNGAAEGYTGDEQSLAKALTPPIAYRNRWSSDVWVGNSGVAGWYYVAVTIHPEVAKFVSGAVPVTLRTTVKGESKGVPEYDGDAVKAGFGVTDDDREAAKTGKTAAEAEESDNKQVIAFAGIGAGVLLLLGLGGWMLVARRRAPVPAAGPVPGPVPPGGVPPQGQGQQQFGPPGNWPPR
jgi:hypothetical protein